MRFGRIQLLAAALISLGFGAAGCKTSSSTQSPASGTGGPQDEAAPSGEMAQAKASGDAMEVYEALERKIAAGEVDKDARQRAYESVLGWEDGSAAYAFARAALAGRVAEARGLAALDLVKEAERYAMLSMERDPDFRDGAAQRLLGTLYVMAGKHTEKGDSEKGLELLEDLVSRFGDQPINHVRLAEGYISLGDPEGAFDSLCAAEAGKEALPPAEAELLVRLLAEVGGVSVLGCEP